MAILFLFYEFVDADGSIQDKFTPGLHTQLAQSLCIRTIRSNCVEHPTRPGLTIVIPSSPPLDGYTYCSKLWRHRGGILNPLRSPRAVISFSLQAWFLYQSISVISVFPIQEVVLHFRFLYFCLRSSLALLLLLLMNKSFVQIQS